ncbi:MAG TPA: class I SAM-dependent methyltransferase [Polyangiaceae bacterium]|nr:class I SAM-dependent methyltransferase [Polyangiaceae bacterium]
MAPSLQSGISSAAAVETQEPMPVPTPLHEPPAGEEVFYSPAHSEEQERTRCPLCGSDAERLVFEVGDTMFHQPGKYRLVECEDCSMRYLNPRPTMTALARHYPDDYLCYTNLEDEHWLLRWAFNRLQQDQARRRVRQIEAVTGRLATGTRVLDVGCGRGEFMARLKRVRHCRCTGIDVNRAVLERVHHELGIAVVHGTLAEAACPAASFDMVAMTEYLEHESRPRRVIEEARRVVKPGGYLAIEVPDITGPPGRWFGDQWWQLDAPRHISFFSPHTLTLMLEDCGFEVLRIKRYGLLMSMGYSLLQAMGFHYFGSNKLAYLTLSAMLGLPSVPFLPLLPDFMMVVARSRT